MIVAIVELLTRTPIRRWRMILKTATVDATNGLSSPPPIGPMWLQRQQRQQLRSTNKVQCCQWWHGAASRLGTGRGSIAASTLLGGSCDGRVPRPRCWCRCCCCCCLRRGGRWAFHFCDAGRSRERGTAVRVLRRRGYNQYAGGATPSAHYGDFRCRSNALMEGLQVVKISWSPEYGSLSLTSAL